MWAQASHTAELDGVERVDTKTEDLSSIPVQQSLTVGHPRWSLSLLTCKMGPTAPACRLPGPPEPGPQNGLCRAWPSLVWAQQRAQGLSKWLSLGGGVGVPLGVGLGSATGASDVMMRRLPLPRGNGGLWQGQAGGEQCPQGDLEAQALLRCGGHLAGMEEVLRSGVVGAGAKERSSGFGERWKAQQQNGDLK